MACQLQAQGERMALLAVLDGYAPASVRTHGSPTDPRDVVRFARNVPYWLGDYAHLGYKPLLARVRRYARRIQRANLAQPEDALDDTSALTADARTLITCHMRALRAYRPERYEGRLSLFRVRRLSLLRAHDPTMGWGQLASGVELHFLSGSHHNILEAPHVQSLAAQLRARLNAAETAGAGAD
jgi:thioesterase domain-containing protein